MNRAGSLPDPYTVSISVWLPHFKVAKRDSSGNIEQSAIIRKTGEWSVLPLSTKHRLLPPCVSTSPQHSPRPRASGWAGSQHGPRGQPLAMGVPLILLKAHGFVDKKICSNCILGREWHVQVTLASLCVTVL